jgi:hypothetical protein
MVEEHKAPQTISSIGQQQPCELIGSFVLITGQGKADIPKLESLAREFMPCFRPNAVAVALNLRKCAN